VLRRHACDPHPGGLLGVRILILFFTAKFLWAELEILPPIHLKDPVLSDAGVEEPLLVAYSSRRISKDAIYTNEITYLEEHSNANRGSAS
jgi:hypothetical protein